MLRFSWDSAESAIIQHCIKKAFESTAASPSVCALIEQSLWEKMVGIEGDGCAVPFEECVDIDNDLINFEAPTEQQIIESLAEVDEVGSSESDDQPEDIVPGEELNVSCHDAIKCIDKLRRFCIEQGLDYTPAAEWFCFATSNS